MDKTQVMDELNYRIQTDLAYFIGRMPERNAIAWYGYLAGLLEWGIIDIAEHAKLASLLPPIPDDLVAAILLGRDNDSN